MQAKEFFRLFEYKGVQITKKEYIIKRRDAIMQRVIATVPPSGHAHNDVNHSRPLFDALSHGFLSIEADIYFRNGHLFIAHDSKDIVPSRTLQSLYLEPLVEQIKKNNGSVYGDGKPLTLLIDVKTNSEKTYLALHQVLRRFQKILTVYSGQYVQEGAIDVIVSGNRSLELMKTQDVRYAAYDGRLSDLEFGASAALVPLISGRWIKHFTWNGDGIMPRQERVKLNRIVANAHVAGQRVRFWDTPDKPGRRRDTIWRTLSDAGVDFINTDDLSGLEKFLDKVRLQSRRSMRLRNLKGL